MAVKDTIRYQIESSRRHVRPSARGSTATAGARPSPCWRMDLTLRSRADGKGSRTRLCDALMDEYEHIAVDVALRSESRAALTHSRRRAS